MFQNNLNIFYFINKMKYIFTLLTLLFSPNLSFKEVKPKLCINCKYFISGKNNDDKYGKCELFKREESKKFELVNGIREDETKYNYCVIARELEFLCGIEGKMYKKKYTRKVILDEKKN